MGASKLSFNRAGVRELKKVEKRWLNYWKGEKKDAVDNWLKKN
jgi:hypothetical protein